MIFIGYSDDLKLQPPTAYNPQRLYFSSKQLEQVPTRHVCHLTAETGRNKKTNRTAGLTNKRTDGRKDVQRQKRSGIDTGRNLPCDIPVCRDVLHTTFWVSTLLSSASSSCERSLTDVRMKQSVF